MHEIQTVPETAMPPQLDAAIREALCVSFPADRNVFSRTRAWHGSPPTWSVLVRDRESVIAHAGVVERKITAGTKELLIGGIQNVLVAPHLRGQGLFRSIMSAVDREAARRNYDLGLLFCTADLCPLYARLGWLADADRKVTRIAEDGESLPLPEGNITMYLPVRMAELPPGDIHLQGNDW